LASQETGLDTHLFVYGTLMGRAQGALGARERARLRAEGRSLGAASLPGVLYDLGAYPGFAQPPNVRSRVFGEVIIVANAPATFLWLDAYEGIVPGKPEISDYERRQFTVALASGQALHAWVYVSLRGLEGARAIRDGRWLA
jgi:gamma-glutamylcyclotransferase (GGCT)/AIG2-like uncharacterized protein YtfP